MAYIFTSKRLGFRNWNLKNDLLPLAKINASAKVMKYFPSIQSKEITESSIKRMQQSFDQHGYTYFAVDELASKNFIGFIGLLNQTWESAVTPCVDIGWRLDPAYWNKGYATEGAKRCLEYGLEVIQLNKIVAMAPIINRPSIAVMKKIGMLQQQVFKHPLLTSAPHLEECVLYSVLKN